MSYSAWNELIAREWFQEKNAGKHIILAIDDELISTIATRNRSILAHGCPDPVDDFSLAVRGSSTWQKWKLNPRKLPDTCACLAMAVLAATRMDAGDTSRSHRGTLRYWEPFLHLFDPNAKTESKTQMPTELREVWLHLWKDIEKWANIDNRGKYGFLRFPEVLQDTHKNVRFPKSQALLNLDDLRRMTGWFNDQQIKPGDSIPLSVLGDSIQRSVGHRANPFSKHARIVLSDSLRYDSALHQIRSYISNWDGEIWNSNVGTSTSQIYYRYVFDLNTAKAELNVGLQQHEKKHWKIVQKYDHFPLTQIEQSRLANKPKTQSHVIAIWNVNERVYVESRSLAPGDRFLALYCIPHFWGSAKNNSRWLGELLDDFELVAEKLEVFVSSRMAQVGDSLAKMQCIESNWLLYVGRVRGDLDAQRVPSRFDDLFVFDVARIHAIGGIKLSRKEWMTGGGPELRIFGPSLSGRIICITNKNTDEASTIEFEHGIAKPMQGRSWPLDLPGMHQLLVEGHETSDVVIQVRDGTFATAEQTKLGWTMNGQYSAYATRLGNAKAYITGAEVFGVTPVESEEKQTNPARDWLNSVLACNGLVRQNNLKNLTSPVARQLAMANRSLLIQNNALVAVPKNA